MNWIAIGVVGTWAGVMIAVYMTYLARKSARTSEAAATRAVEIQAESVDLERRKHWQQLVNDGVEAFKQRGTPVFYVYGLQGLNDEEKERLWKDIFLMHKGRMPRRLFRDDASITIKD